MHVHALRCFGAAPGTGNPALVIEGDPSPAPARQAFARERDTTCVWIDDAAADGGLAVVDFYYPHARSPLCLHATLAAAQRLSARPGAPAQLAVRSAMHGQLLGLLRVDGTLFVRLAAQPVAQPVLAPGEAARLLRLPPSADGAGAAAPRVASVGSPKLLVDVGDAATLHALAPDLDAIAAWSRRHGVNGVYAWCRHADGRFEGRNFNHLEPRLEDSATGVAAGALTLLIGHGLALQQGRATGRDCLIQTRLDGDAVLVGGRVEAC